MPAFRLPVFVYPTLGAVVLSLTLAAHAATAQSATATVTGRVLWGSCVRGIPLPMAPDTTQPPEAQPFPIRPGSGGVIGLPAGAVLVAAQNTAVSARTDEAGRFTLSGVPAGLYLTISAGPVADATTATADRPNVMLSGGQTLDIGTLSLGGPTPLGIACRAPGPLSPDGSADATPATTTGSDPTTP